MYSLTGMCVSEGVAEGKALQLRRVQSSAQALQPEPFNCDNEIRKFRRACTEFVTRLHHVMQGPAPDKVRDLFGAVAGFISAADNQEEILEAIREGNTARQACTKVLLENLKPYTHSKDAEILAQTRELQSLAREFIASLDQNQSGALHIPELTEPSVIIAEDLSPARFLCLRTDLVSAVVLEGGLSSGHLGAVLRELRIPAVFSVIGATSIKNGEHILVDANNSTVMIEPPQDAASQLKSEQYSDDDDLGDEPLCHITIACSVGASRDLTTNQSVRHHGLGLLRSEFLFLTSATEPTEAEMTSTFAELFSGIPADAPITARTFDFAGDKKPLFALNTDEQGPLRGYGAEVGSALIKKELRALLQAAPNRDITIVFPLVCRISEAKCLTDLLSEATDELMAEDRPIARPTTALMIETPAAVLSAKAFASFASHFVIGTSSLAEYASAPRQPDIFFTPALAKMIALACKAAAESEVTVGVAGRFAARPELLPFFLKLGISSITVDAYSVLKLRAALEKLDMDNFLPVFDHNLYDQIMALSSGREITALINNLNFLR